MLECPSCGQRVNHQGRDNWFECPACRNWLRLRVNSNGSTWLELGVLANGYIQPVQLVRQPGTPSRAPVSGQNSASLPNVDQLDLETVQTYRQRIAAKLRELENNIQRAISLRNQSRQNEQSTGPFNSALSLYTREQNEWQQYDQLLEKREEVLRQEERERARQAGSSGGSGIVFGCGTILAGVGIYAFSRMIGLQLDLRMFMYLALIAFVSGLITIVIAQFD